MSTLDESRSQFAKHLLVAPAKEGKTVFLAASALGVLPGQQGGGIVSSPKNLHLIAIDSGAVTGVRPFLNMCGMADTDIAKITVHNLQEVTRQANIAPGDWNYSFFNSLMLVASAVEKAVLASNAVSLVLVSSVTTVAQTLERQLAGPSSESRKGSGMDQSKWSELARQMSEFRNKLQQDRWHCWWEGHCFRPPSTGQGDEQRPETLQMSGKSGYNFPNNVEHVFRLRRQWGDVYSGTKIDKVYADTRPALDFLSGGRCTTEFLPPKVYNLTSAFQKLGLRVGLWQAKASDHQVAPAATQKDS